MKSEVLISVFFLLLSLVSFSLLLLLLIASFLRFMNLIFIVDPDRIFRGDADDNDPADLLLLLSPGESFFLGGAGDDDDHFCIGDVSDCELFVGLALPGFHIII